MSSHQRADGNNNHTASPQDPNVPNRLTFVSPTQGTSPDEVAELRAKLSQTEQQLQAISGTTFQVVHPPSQRAIQHKQSVETKNEIRDIVKKNLWHIVKFVVKDDEAKMVTEMCYDAYIAKYAKTNLSEKHFVYYYFSFVMNELNKHRMYVSGRTYLKGYKHWPATLASPTIKDLEACLKHTLDAKNDNAMTLFNWYMDKYLPHTTGSAIMFGQSVRHYNTISDAVDPNDPSCKAITVETEAFAVLNFENNLSKWKYYDETLDDEYKDFQYVPCNRKKDDPVDVEFVAVEKNEKKILRIFSPKAKGKYTKSDCGQARYGGWSREGMVRYNKLVSFALQGRRHPKNCAPLERASLQAVRLKYGKTANTAEEERLGKRKRNVSAPVDDGFTTLRYNREQARGVNTVATLQPPRLPPLPQPRRSIATNPGSNVARLPPMNELFPRLKIPRHWVEMALLLPVLDSNRAITAIVLVKASPLSS